MPEPTPVIRRATEAVDLQAIADKIKAEWTKLQEAEKGLAERALTFGKLLIEAKEKVGHNNWLKWLETNCKQISDRTANRYMELAAGEKKLVEKMKTKSATMADLTINGALALIKDKPKPQGDVGTTLLNRIDLVMSSLDKIKKEKGLEEAIEEIEAIRQKLDAKEAELTKEKIKSDRKQKGKPAEQHATP
jgi:Protein of unknown function (DUF3102)